MVDDRDDRIVSLFQAWLVREIIPNPANFVNVLMERDQVNPPSSGFHLIVFAKCTLEGHVRGFGGRGEWRSMRRLGWSNCPGAFAPSILAIFMADAEGHNAVLCGREGLQWERDLVPLGHPRLSSGHGPLGPAALRG